MMKSGNFISLLFTGISFASIFLLSLLTGSEFKAALIISLAASIILGLGVYIGFDICESMYEIPKEEKKRKRKK